MCSTTTTLPNTSPNIGWGQVAPHPLHTPDLNDGETEAGQKDHVIPPQKEEDSKRGAKLLGEKYRHNLKILPGYVFVHLSKSNMQQWTSARTAGGKRKLRWTFVTRSYTGM